MAATRANGFADEQSVWIDGLPQRLDVANTFASRAIGSIDPVALIDTALGRWRRGKPATRSRAPKVGRRG